MGSKKDYINEDLQEEDLYDYFYNFKEEPYEGLTIKSIFEKAEEDSIWTE